MGNLPKNVAIVYDRINKWGGAERVLLELHKLFPQSPIYTSVYNYKQATWSQVFTQIIPSFLNRLPFASRHHELLGWITPLAFETFDLKSYDAVISVTSADAKSVITPPGCFHLCYCLTPTRYLYSHANEYQKQMGKIWSVIARPWLTYVRMHDQIACYRPDAYLGISQTVAKRIDKYYHQTADVVYPPVDTDFFCPDKKDPSLGDYFLSVGRFVSYKHPEKIIQAFNETGQKLLIVGEGRANWGQSNPLKNLKNKAKSNITFIGSVTDDELKKLYQKCMGLVYFHEEDFGIVPIEAMACGRPVIGLNRGGLSETVINKKTGVLTDDDSVASLIRLLKSFKPYMYDSGMIRKQALKFSSDRFRKEFSHKFNFLWKQHKNTFMY